MRKKYIVFKIRTTAFASHKIKPAIQLWYESKEFDWLRERSGKELLQERTYDNYSDEVIFQIRAELSESDYIYWKLKYT